MRYLILSDIHSNDEALAAVLCARARASVSTASWCSATSSATARDPNQVVDADPQHPASRKRIDPRQPRQGGLRGRLGRPLQPGGADGGALDDRTAHAREPTSSCEALPLGPDDRSRTRFAICHGSPLDEDAYVFSDFDAYVNFRDHRRGGDLLRPQPHPVDLLPRAARHPGRASCGASACATQLEEGMRYLINPGSIGQPRDRNAAAAYAIYDADERIVHFDRVPYPVEKTREKIYKAGLPAHPRRSPPRGRLRNIIRPVQGRLRLAKLRHGLPRPRGGVPARHRLRGASPRGPRPGDADRRRRDRRDVDLGPDSDAVAGARVHVPRRGGTGAARAGGPARLRGADARGGRVGERRGGPRPRGARARPDR